MKLCYCIVKSVCIIYSVIVGDAYIYVYHFCVGVYRHCLVFIVNISLTGKDQFSYIEQHVGLDCGIE